MRTLVRTLCPGAIVKKLSIKKLLDNRCAVWYPIITKEKENKNMLITLLLIMILILLTIITFLFIYWTFDLIMDEFEISFIDFLKDFWNFLTNRY